MPPSRILVTVSMVFTAAALSSVAAGQDLVSEDICVLSIQAPPGARVTLSGKDYGQRREFEWKSLKAGTLYPVPLQVTQAGRELMQKKLYIRGGWRIRVPVAATTSQSIEIVPQLGVRVRQGGGGISSDGRRVVLLQSASARAIVVDVETGREVRHFDLPDERAYYTHLSPDGAYLVVVGGAKTGLYDVRDGRLLHLYDTPGKFGFSQSRPGIAFSSNNRYFAMVNGNLFICDTIEGTIVRTIKPDQYDDVELVRFHPDDTKVLFSAGDSIALYDLKNGRTLYEFEPDPLKERFDFKNPFDLRFNKSGDKFCAVVHYSNGVGGFRIDNGVARSIAGREGEGHFCHEVGVWDTASGRRIQRILPSEVYSRAKRDFRPAPDRLHFAWFEADGSLRVIQERFKKDEPASTWLYRFDPSSGERLDAEELDVWPERYSTNFAQDPNGRWFFDGQCVTDMKEGLVHKLPPRPNLAVSAPASVKISSDGNYMLVRGNILQKYWGFDCTTGEQTCSLDNPLLPNARGAPHRDWKNIVTVLDDGEDREYVVTDLVTQRRIGSFPEKFNFLYSDSDDSGRFYRFTFDKAFFPSQTVKYRYGIWDTGKGRWTFGLQDCEEYPSVGISRNGQYVFEDINGNDGVVIRDVLTGRRVSRLVDASGSHHLAFSPDGSHLVGYEDRASLGVWRTSTGEKLHVIAGASRIGEQAVLSYDNSLVAQNINSGGTNWGSDEPPQRYYERRRTKVWRVATGTLLREFTGHSGEIHPPEFHPDGRHVVTCSSDMTVRIWDLAIGDEAGRIYVLNNGRDWLVVTPEGLFDGSEGGMQQVMFRIGGGLNVVPVSRLFQDFYREGLLARIMAGERPVPTVDLAQSIPPSLTILSPKEGGETGLAAVTLEVQVKDNGGGVQGPFLRHNGARLAATPKVRRLDAKTAVYTFTTNLLEGENRLRVEAASGDGAWESEPVQLTFTYNKTLPKPDLYLLVVGVNAYAEDSLKLAYATADVEAISDVFTQRGDAFYDHVYVTPLLNERASKTAIRDALREVAGQAREQDTLLVYFSGHGFTVGQRYYFIPQEFRFKSPRFEDDVEDQGLPGDQIFREVGETKALKRVLVLDTCNSGAVLKKSGTKKRSGFAFAGAIRRLSRSQGVFTIAASAATDETAEVRELGHGVLTYSLLAGLQAVTGPKTADGNGDGVVNISEWFGYAADEVPKLTKKYLRIQQDVHQRSEGVSFPVLPVPKD